MQQLFYCSNSASTLFEQQLMGCFLDERVLLQNCANLNFQLTKTLIANQVKLTTRFSQKTKSSTNSQNISENSPNSGLILSQSIDSKKKPSILQQQLPENSFSQIQKPELNQEPQVQLRRKRKVRYQCEDSFEDVKKMPNSRPSQAKNVIKNLMNAIINFIKKERQQWEPIKDELNISEEKIIEMADNLCGKIVTIRYLRELWCTNKYSKFFRMITENYMRKRYMKYVFNSRVHNYSVHLKYRTKILESLKKPEEFTNLKDF